MRTTKRWLQKGFVAIAIASSTWPLFAAALPSGPAEVPPFFGVRAGTTLKSTVDGMFGTPTGGAVANTYEYRAVAGAADIAHQVIEYFPDTQQVARLDAYLKSPLSAAAIRGQFGVSVLTRQRGDGKQEELFYPRLNGVIYAQGKPDEVIAISYISPRALADIYVDEFNQHRVAKRYPEALQAADNAVKVDPDYARGYLSQGLYYYFQNNDDEALVRFTAASRASYNTRKKSHAHVWMGIVYAKKKQLELAREQFRKAIAVAPDFSTAYFEYGKFLVDQNQPEQAEAAYRKAVQINPDDMQSRYEIGMIHYRGKAWEKAQPHFKQLSDWADSPNSANAAPRFKSDIYGNFARVTQELELARNPLAGSELADKLIALYEKGLRADPGSPFICNNIGYEYERTGRLDKAEQYYRQGLATDPKHEILNRNLADILMAMRRYEEARRQAEVALGIKANDPWMMMNAARSSAALGRRDDALAWLRKAGAAGYQAKMDGNALEGGYFAGIVSDDELRRMLPGRR